MSSAGTLVAFGLIMDRSFLILGALLMAGGCSNNGDEQREALEAHLRQWNVRAPSEYVIRICGTGFSAFCSLSAVSGGKVVAERSGIRPNPLRDVTPSETEPVSELFAQATAATHVEDCDVERLTFDGTYGYVSNYYADCDQEGSGEEVQCFEPNTLELDACATP